RRTAAGADPQPQDRVRLPVVQPHPAHHGRAQRRAADGLRPRPRAGAAPPGVAGVGAGGAGRARPPPPVRAVRRAAAARGDRPGDRDRPRAAAGRRADGRARQPQHGRGPRAFRRPQRGRPDARGDHPRGPRRTARAARAAHARRPDRVRRAGGAGGGVVNPGQILQFAVAGVLANKLRSALTMSGIVIGVAAVIILVAVGTGAGRAATAASISALGSNTLTITPESDQGGGGRGGVRISGGGLVVGGSPRPVTPPGQAGPSTQTDRGTEIRAAQLTLADAEALVDAELAPSVASVAPVVSATSVTATRGGASHDVATLTGTTPSYLTNHDDAVQAGAAFTDSDYLARSRVALVGVTVATALVGGDGRAIVGQPIQLNGAAFQVVGLLAAKGSSGPQDQDDRVIAPMTAVQDTLTGYGPLSSISVRAVSAEAVPAATAEVTAILNARHGTGVPDFSISSPTSILEAVSEVNATFTLLLGAVAGISLLVGGIGVMNIM